MQKTELGTLLIDLEEVLKKLTLYWHNHTPEEVEKDTIYELPCDACEEDSTMS